MSEKDKIKAFNDRQMGQMAEKIHAAMLVVKGTAGTPDLKSIRDEVERVIGWSKEGEEKDETYFWGTSGFIVYVDRHGSPWPTYTFFVPATTNMYVRPEED